MGRNIFIVSIGINLAERHEKTPYGVEEKWKTPHGVQKKWTFTYFYRKFHDKFSSTNRIVLSSKFIEIWQFKVTKHKIFFLTFLPTFGSPVKSVFNQNLTFSFTQTENFTIYSMVSINRIAV